MPAVVIVPTYRNVSTLPQVLDEICRAGLQVIVVDDGSGDGTAAFLEAWVRQHQQCRVCVCEHNAGKASALVRGFDIAAAEGYDIALTMDADGQHCIDDALHVLAAASTDTIVCGARDERALAYPWTSLFGRRLWALGIRSLAGIGVSDPVCGLRAYPVEKIRSIKCLSHRYAWEEEALVRAAWYGVKVSEVAIRTVYVPVETRVTHYRIIRDWSESLAIYCRLAIERLLLLDRKKNVKQPLAKRDLSSQWLIGSTILVGMTCGTVLPLILLLPLMLFVGIRANAGLWIGMAAAILGAVIANVSVGAALAAAVVACAGFILYPRAQPRGSN